MFKQKTDDIFIDVHLTYTNKRLWGFEKSMEKLKAADKMKGRRRGYQRVTRMPARSSGQAKGNKIKADHRR